MLKLLDSDQVSTVEAFAIPDGISSGMLVTIDANRRLLPAEYDSEYVYMVGEISSDLFGYRTAFVHTTGTIFCEVDTLIRDCRNPPRSGGMLEASGGFLIPRADSSNSTVVGNFWRFSSNGAAVITFTAAPHVRVARTPYGARHRGRIR
jgi:hypothetical protein